MATFSTQAQDGATAKFGVIGLTGAQLVTEGQVLLGDIFEGSTLDTSDRWSTTVANGGSVTQTSAGGLVINPSTATNGTATIQSNVVVPYLAGSEIVMRVSARTGTAGVASNTRQIALRVDSNNYISFLLDSTSFVARVQSGGSQFSADAPISIVSPDALAAMELEIRVSRSPDEVHFLAGTEEKMQGVATFVQRGSATRLFQGALAQVYCQSVNSGSAVANTLILNSVLVTQRFTMANQVIRSKKMTADGIVVRGPAFYFGMDRIANGGGSAIMYDNVAASGEIVDQYGTDAQRIGPWASPRFCYNGLYLDLTTDNVVVYYIPV